METLVKNIPIRAIISMSWKIYKCPGVRLPLCGVANHCVVVCEVVGEGSSTDFGKTLVVCLGHIPQISTPTMVDRFEEEACKGDLEDPAQQTTPCHNPSAYSSNEM